jgi:RNA polymerase sigma-70 factor, ECF subfamily
MSLIWPMPLHQRFWLAITRRDGSSAAHDEVGAEMLSRFEAFFRRYEPELTGYLWRMTGDAETARDLCQETFTRAWQHFTQLTSYAQPRQWLYRVATNLALKLRRRPATASLGDHDPAMSDPTGRVIEREQVRQILAALPAKSRAILILREVQQFSYAEIGALVSMSPDAVKMAVSRARAQFRQQYLTQEGE